MGQTRLHPITIRLRGGSSLLRGGGELGLGTLHSTSGQTSDGISEPQSDSPVVK